ncbi:hypothetical protein [Mesorhizobium sp. J428]|nr:hypothetical protein [Mesorhizobium sp. J428]MCR5857172.1 hypothetical protein [Mesorhizobium sp. J428]
MSRGEMELPMRGLLLAFLTSGFAGSPAGAGARMLRSTKTTAKTKTAKTV